MCNEQNYAFASKYTTRTLYFEFSTYDSISELLPTTKLKIICQILQEKGYQFFMKWQEEAERNSRSGLHDPIQRKLRESPLQPSIIYLSVPTPDKRDITKKKKTTTTTSSSPSSNVNAYAHFIHALESIIDANMGSWFEANLLCNHDCTFKESLYSTHPYLTYSNKKSS